MRPRTFTTNLGSPDERIYKGFDKNFKASETNHIALFSIDGDLELFVLDDPKNTSDLMAYLCDWNPGHIIPLGVYSRR